MGVQKSGEGDKDKGKELDIQSRLPGIPTRSKSKVLRGIEKIFQVADKVVLAYMEQMEELQTMASEKEAREALEEEVKTLKAQLTSLCDCNKAKLERERKRVDSNEAEKKKAQEGWVAALTDANLNLVKCSELEGSIERLKEDVKAKEKGLRKEILRKKVAKAIIDFKAGKMAEDLKWTPNEGTKKFKCDELPTLLQGEIDHTIQAFPYSTEGQSYFYRDWGRGLLEFTDVVLHYQPEIEEKWRGRSCPSLRKRASQGGAKSMILGKWRSLVVLRPRRLLQPLPITKIWP